MEWRLSMGDLKFIIYFFMCIWTIDCQMTTDTCRAMPGVTLDAEDNANYITSPGYPDTYPDNLNCLWIIRSTGKCGLIRINVESLDLEVEYDKLQLSYGSLLEPEQQVVTTSEYEISSESVEIQFTTDDSNGRQGFQISYSLTDTSDMDVMATNARKSIAPSAFLAFSDTVCQWNIVTSAACTLLRLETSSGDTDETTIQYDGGLRELRSQQTYLIPGTKSVLRSKTGILAASISYQTEDLNIGKTPTVFGCQDFQLSADVESRYVLSSNYPDTNRNTDCDWMIFAAESCSTNKGNITTISIVVEDFKTSGSSPITIFQAASRGNVTIYITQESGLIGHPLVLYVSAAEFVLITARHIGEESAFNISYQVMEPVAEHDERDDTLLIALATTMGIVCIVTVIVHIAVCCIRRQRSTQTKPASHSVKFHNVGQERTKRPYVGMNLRQPSGNRNQQETRSSGEYYEVVEDGNKCEASIAGAAYQDVANAKDLGTYKQDGYYAMETPEAETEQCSDMYLNPDPNNVACSQDDEDVYQIVDDYENVSEKRF